MAATDLCSLPDVKSWLNIAAATSDAQLNTLITAASRAILGYINRPFILPTQQTERRNGTGGRSFMLSDWPVQSVASLYVNGVLIAPIAGLPPFGDGYLIDTALPMPPGEMQLLTLTQRLFSRCIQNVQVTYTAGYQVTAEPAVIPTTPFQITAQAPYGSWGSDQGVTFANGTALVAVATAPAAGQYSIAAGLYQFAAADAGKAVLISYGYVPADLRQACIETVGERFRAKDRIGIQSKTLASQETITYSAKDLSAPIKMMLSYYARVVKP